MKYDNVRHPTSDELEGCLLGHVLPEQALAVEEHLLICEDCRVAMNTTAADTIALRETLREFRQEVTTSARKRWSPAPFSPAYGAVFAIVLAVVSIGFWSRTQRGPIPESDVSLYANRGVDPAANAVASGSIVRLHLDTIGLPPAPAFRVELVDRTGAPVWSARSAPQTPSLALRIDKPLQTGRYWVRVNDENGEPLREYQLDVK